MTKFINGKSGAARHLSRSLTWFQGVYKPEIGRGPPAHQELENGRHIFTDVALDAWYASDKGIEDIAAARTERRLREEQQILRRIQKREGAAA